MVFEIISLNGPGVPDVAVPGRFFHINFNTRIGRLFALTTAVFYQLQTACQKPCPEGYYGNTMLSEVWCPSMAKWEVRGGTRFAMRTLPLIVFFMIFYFKNKNTFFIIYSSLFILYIFLTF